MKTMIAFVLMSFLTINSFAGNTVRGPGGGATGVPEGGNGAILSLDVWNKILEGEESNFCAGLEGVLGTAKITDSLGRKMESKKIFHALPYLDYARKVDDNFAFFANVYAKDAQGFAFENNFEQWGFDTEALIARINIGLGISWKIDDVWTVALEADLGIEQLKLNYAFDINRFYLPIFTKTKGYGFGLGVTGAVICQATEKLRLGFQISSPMRMHCKGRTDLFGGEVSDSWKAEMDFPLSLHLAGSYQLTERLGACADVNWYDFKDDPVVLKFNHWGFEKPLQLGFGEVFSVRGGFNYLVTDSLLVRVGGGYMTQGVARQYNDSTTTDIPGFYYALGFTYKVTGSIDLSLAYTHAEGKSSERSSWLGLVPGSKIEVGLDTIAVECSYKF